MRTIFTNGCFDILHVGHVRLLKFAKSLGDVLIVGINTDDSCRRIKGNKRPIMPLSERMELLLELQCVNDVIPFDSNTPESLIEMVRPDVLVKGPGERGNFIPGAGYVKSYGGSVVIPEWEVVDQSTSKIINKIIGKYLGVQA